MAVLDFGYKKESQAKSRFDGFDPTIGKTKTQPIPAVASVDMPVDDSIPEARDILGAPQGEADFSGLPKAASPYVHGFAGGGGALIGTAAGAVSPMPGGAIFGGAGGFAMGEQLADLYDEFVGIKKAPETYSQGALNAVDHFKTGLLFEMGGPAAGVVGKHTLGPVAKGIGAMAKDAYHSLPGVKPNLAKTEAHVGDLIYQILKGRKSLDDLPEESVLALKKEMPDLQISFGEETNNQAVLALEAAGKVSKGTAGILDVEAKAVHNNNVLMDYMKAKVSRGVGGSQSDVVAALESVAEANKLGVTAAEEDLAKVAGIVKGQADISATGAFARDHVDDAFEIARKKRQTEWEIMPDTEPLVGASNEIANKLVKIQDAFHGSTAVISDFPKVIINAIEKLQTPRTLKELQEIKSMVGKYSRSYRSAGNTGTESANKAVTDVYDNVLDIFKRKISDSLGGGKYEHITSNYKKYIDTFRTGPIGQVLKENKVTDSLVPGKFLKPKSPELADKLIEVVGKDKATEIARRDALFRLYDKTKGNLTSKNVGDFFSQNEVLLKKFGLEGEFNSFATTAKNLETAVKADKEFQSTVASKMIGKNLGSTLHTIFKDATPESKEKTVNSILGILKKTKGSAEAISGVKNSILDYIMHDKAGKGFDDFASMTEKMRTFDPVLNIFFKKPELDAMYSVRKALDVFTRTAKRSPTETEAEFGKRLVDMITPMVVSKYSRIVAVKTIVKSLLSAETSRVNDLLYSAAFNPEVMPRILKKAESMAFTKSFSKETASPMAGFMNPKSTSLEKEQFLTGKLKPGQPLASFPANGR
ncbi:MAG: hypothetical protein DRP85_08835 [Candidatus Makaraimicrobium thalassicum]|nr:MAG: hypothetical protein DRP85_08835 [Candidatus Omnitrophota bacterium]